MRSETRGFTLIELLIVVAIIGMIAAIAIPALTSAIQRARQKRTIAELRSLATAVSNYAVDYATMPMVGPGNADLLQPYLMPTYVKRLTGLDGWMQPIRYEANGLDYTLWSFGADGIQQPALTLGVTTNFGADIVISNGVFVQWPDGMQTR